MRAIFTPVDQENWVRKPYFDYYYQTIECKYNINYNVDISCLVEEIKVKGLKFYPSFLYVIMRSDGYHTCKLVNDIQDIANNVKDWI